MEKVFLKYFSIFDADSWMNCFKDELLKTMNLNMQTKLLKFY